MWLLIQNYLLFWLAIAAIVFIAYFIAKCHDLEHLKEFAKDPYHYIVIHFLN